MVAFQLPETTIVHSTHAEKNISLSTKGEWKSLSTNIKIKLEKQKTVLITYNINIKVNNDAFSVRLKIVNAGKTKFNVRITLKVII